MLYGKLLQSPKSLNYKINPRAVMAWGFIMVCYRKNMGFEYNLDAVSIYRQEIIDKICLSGMVTHITFFVLRAKPLFVRIRRS